VRIHLWTVSWLRSDKFHANVPLSEEEKRSMIEAVLASRPPEEIERKKRSAAHVDAKAALSAYLRSKPADDQRS
jgi:hypothetical protein